MRSIFCCHKWHIIKDTITESEIEMLVRIKAIPNKFNGFMASRKYVMICTCLACGKIKKFVEKI